VLELPMSEPEPSEQGDALPLLDIVEHSPVTSTAPSPRWDSSEPDAPPLKLDFDSDDASGSALALAEQVGSPAESKYLSSSLELEPAKRTSTFEATPHQEMRERYAMGDFTGALVIAESLLEGNPNDLDAIRYAESCRDVLGQMYAARLGSLHGVVEVMVPGQDIRWLSLDHRAGFLLSLVDGSLTVEEILDVCGMPRLEAMRILYNLLDQRIISVGD
jgi:hypothetical protein